MDESTCTAKHEALNRELQENKQSFEVRFKELREHLISEANHTNTSVDKLTEPVRINSERLIRIETKVEGVETTIGELKVSINELAKKDEEQLEKLEVEEKKEVAEIITTKKCKINNLWYPLLALAGGSGVGFVLDIVKKFILK
jgi:hypothetical protein